MVTPGPDRGAAPGDTAGEAAGRAAGQAVVEDAGGAADRSAPTGRPTTDERVWAADPRWAHAAPVDLTAVERLVVVAAHPDDETLGLGGLLAQLPDGIPVDVVVATDGRASHPHSPTHTPQRLAERRRAEVADALALLRPGAELHLLGLTDGGLAQEQDELTAALVRLGPGPGTLLAAPYRADGHPDHEAAGRAAAAAAWRTDARLMEYPVWAWHWRRPDDLPWADVRLVPLSPRARAVKARAVAGHVSQVEPLSDRPGDEVLLPPEVLGHFDRQVEVLLVAEPGEESPFEELHERVPDPWEVRTSDYEARKRRLTLDLLPHTRYDVALEIGCSIGVLADELTGRSDRVVGVDESQAAVAVARESLGGRGAALHARLPEDWPAVEPLLPGGEGSLLVVVSEVGYFLSPRRLSDLAARIRGAVSGLEHAAVVACHWRHEIVGWPLRGGQVHEVLHVELGLPRVEHVVEDDVLLSVWSR